MVSVSNSVTVMLSGLMVNSGAVPAGAASAAGALKQWSVPCHFSIDNILSAPSKPSYSYTTAHIFIK